MESRGFLALFLLTTFTVSNGMLGFDGINGGGTDQMLLSSQSYARFRLRRELSENFTPSGAKTAQSEARHNPDVITLDSPVTSDVIGRLMSTATKYVRSALRKTSNPWPILIKYKGMEESVNEQQNATLLVSDQTIGLIIRDQVIPNAVFFMSGLIWVSLKSDLTIAIGRDLVHEDIIKIFNKGLNESIQIVDRTATDGETCVAKSSLLESLIFSIENDKILTIDTNSYSEKNAMSRLHVTTRSIIIDLDSDLTLSFTTDSIDLYSGTTSYLSLSSDSLDLYFEDVKTSLSLSDDGIDLSLDEQNGVLSFYDYYTLAMSFDKQKLSVSFNENVDFSVRDKNFTVGMHYGRFKLLHPLRVPDLKITLTSELAICPLDLGSSTVKEKRSSDHQSLNLFLHSWGVMVLRISDQLITVVNPLIFGYGNQELFLVIE